MPLSSRSLAAQAVATFLLAAGLAGQQAAADTVWRWHYSGAGLEAGGTLLTDDVADALGFHQILGIAGTRNGEAITSLYPTGSAIPGNEPYALDNLIRLGADGQITVHGFGYATASGGHANPYFADFLNPPRYMEVFTAGSSFAEIPVVFTAAPIPEPQTLGLAAAGLGLVLARRLAGRGAAHHPSRRLRKA